MDTKENTPWYNRIRVDKSTIISLGMLVLLVCATGIVMYYCGKAFCIIAVSLAAISLFTANQECEARR